MAMNETPTVDENAFYEVLGQLRRIRRWAVTYQADPWAFRQAMITVMAIDTACALDSGVEPDGLALFDVRAQDKAQEFLESLPEGWITHGR